MAVINSTFGFVFVHVPKSAGTSVTSLLYNFNTVLDVEIGGSSFGEAIQPAYRRRYGLSKHATASEIIGNVGEVRWKKFLSFGVVRHPVDRLASAFRFLRNWDSPENKHRELVNSFGTFRDFVESDVWVNQEGHDRMFRAQAFWLADSQDRLLVDRVVKLDTLEADLFSVLGQAGIPAIKLNAVSLQRLNVTNKPSVLTAEALPLDCIEKIERRYARDYRLFGFTRSDSTTSKSSPGFSKRSKQALFIDDSVPTPDRDAGSNAAIQHMLILQDLGYDVGFVPADNMACIDPYTSALQKMGVRSFHAPEFRSVKEVCERGLKNVDLVYLHRYSNASKFATMIRQCFPHAVIVYSVADLHHLRQKRELEIEGSLKPEALVVSESDEVKALRAADVVIVHSSVEAALIRGRYPEMRVHVVPWTIQARPVSVKFQDRFGYAFIGGYRHRPNVDAAVYLATRIVPKVLHRNPKVEGVLIGSRPSPEIAQLNSIGLRVIGHVPDLTLELHKLRCTVAPLRYGAGLKGKVLDSLAHGIPCVMSETAAEGMDLPQDLLWLVAKTPDEFAEKIIRLQEEEKLNEFFSKAGLAYVAAAFSREAVHSLLQHAIQ